ncbi:MAG TPA: glycoside hydrolase family 43 protein [Pyrinomonadaceae bacterium]|jgi:GH43 family beta-xylosidase
MNPSQTLRPKASYLNPVHNQSCPDPFVLKFAGEYWCYCTGLWQDGRAFGVLHSRDLVDWRELGGALEVAPESGATCYWAPEVVYDNGLFFMYYSIGDGVRMEVRVAVAEHPSRPFVDSGRRLTKEEFAIDAHVFVDKDGSRYLFYATDFLEHTHIGTGTVRDRLIDPYTLAGEATPVTRARYDWQVYDPAREEKGGVRWHTVEGPFVLRRKGKYYQIFSGGNWQNVSYGVSYATSQRIDATEEWEQVCDGARVLPILRTLPGEVVGPGHNSVVRAPDNQQLFCVYHVWTKDASARVLAIDRLEWVGERMTVLGPSTERVRAPFASTFADFFDAETSVGLGKNWECRGGRWASRGAEAVQEDADTDAEAVCTASEASSFVLEVTIRASSETDGGDGFGVRMVDDESAGIFEFAIVPQTRQAVISWKSEQGGHHTERLALPEQFNPKAFHLLRIEADGARIDATLDDGSARWQGHLGGRGASPHLARRIALFTRGMSASFRGFALTDGWQNLFEGEGREQPSSHGWEIAEGGGESWRVEEGQLRCAPKDDKRVLILKDAPEGSCEIVVNVRLERGTGDGGRYGFYPSFVSTEQGLLLAVGQTAAGDWALEVVRGSGVEHVFALPASFDPFEFQQFRLTKQGEQLFVQWESEMLGAAELNAEPTRREKVRVGLFAEKASAAFDMVRVTSLESTS